MTKADVLDAFKELQVCTAYQVGGREINEIPFQMDRHRPEPVYRNFKGWNTHASAARNYEELPETMKTYVNFINEYLGTPIHYISNGPGRDQIIKVK
jgi:adenylosuccinate synthase